MDYTRPGVDFPLLLCPDQRCGDNGHLVPTFMAVVHQIVYVSPRDGGHENADPYN